MGSRDLTPSDSRFVKRTADDGIYWFLEVRQHSMVGSWRLGELKLHGTWNGDLLCKIEDVRVTKS